MRNIKILTLTLFIFFSSIFPIFAVKEKYGVPIENNPQLIMDKSDLLSDTQEKELLNKLEDIKYLHQCEVIILTVNNLNGLDAIDYADLYYSNNKYGYGVDKTGIMLVVANNERDYSIYLRGSAMDIFSDSRQIYIEDNIKTYLKEDDYYGAFNKFAEICGDFLNQGIEVDDNIYRNNNNNLKENYPKKPINNIAYLFSMLIGFIISAFSVNFATKPLKNVHYNRNANSYIVEDSMTIRNSTDRFLYRNITKVPRPKENISSNKSSNTTRSVGRSGNTYSGRKGKY